VFISYAYDDREHADRARQFWLFLRESGIDARLDKPAAERRQDWPRWMSREMRAVRLSREAAPEYPIPGAERLLRLLTGQPYETEPPVGLRPALPPRGTSDSGTPRDRSGCAPSC
jgi:hypothetical protein